eukprot:CAMPEP_0114343302 /NCGR_PEP_ID=MMETSP0101-20121206/10489_1 /TAXON_ID=38822 ORGANISM="Pteridomonas danica, Strain PT" /NCGR_SAMPLE_ID=MMETSP0101 /ASSEMBLY_ACC=CAM_ASM_000211 /LENGTH=709 /DNA_ID=CAMNT_0001477925 /DNA_START=20 /DNA_END=2149 /DNA_ORIENTATION=-
MSSDARHEDPAASYPEDLGGGIKDGMYFSGVQPGLSGGHMNPFSGENSGRVVSDREVNMKAQLRRKKSGGQVGRIKAIHNRISELERSAITMYTQHAGAAMALEREVAALREERLRLGDELGDIGSSSKPRTRPMSAPLLSPNGGKNRHSWVLTSNPKLRQEATAEQLSKPIRRKTLEPSSSSSKLHHNHSSSSNKHHESSQPIQVTATSQRNASERLSRGNQARPHGWEKHMPSSPQQKQQNNNNQREHSSSNQHSPTNKQCRSDQVDFPSDKKNQSSSKKEGEHKNDKQKKNNNHHQTRPASANKAIQQTKVNRLSKSPTRASFDHFIKQNTSPPTNPKEQSMKMKSLSSPSRKPRDKVVTEGISKSSIDWIQYYGKQTPGPGEYEVDKASKVLIGPTGGRFSKAKPLSHVDVLINDASKKPGPGAYKLKGGVDLISGGAFSTASPLTDVDRLAMEAKLKPGPGEYGPLLVDAKGRTMLGRGRTWSKAKPLSDVDVLINDASKKPGPGAYKLKGGVDLISGGAFSTASPLTDVDRLAMEAKLKPGPGEYGPLLVDAKGRTMLGRGRTWSKAKPLSDVDVLINDASKKPGPGAYKLKGGVDLISGGAFSTAAPLTEVDRLMLDSSRKPGPGEYGAPYNPRKDSIGNTGKFSTSVPLTEVDRLIKDASQKPGPGEYGAPKKFFVENGGSGKFPFVYHPKDTKLSHLSKG